MGEEERRAQSNGECPGVNWTFLRGFVGTAEWEGGGAREEGPRLGSGPRGGAMREDWEVRETGGRRCGAWVPPDALCAELTAGKEGARGPLEARCAELRAGNEGAGSWSSELGARVKVGAGVFGPSMGVLREGWGFLNGGGGGGMALRSISIRLGGGIAFRSRFALLGGGIAFASCSALLEGGTSSRPNSPKLIVGTAVWTTPSRFIGIEAFFELLDPS